MDKPKKPKLSSEEIELFRESCANTKRLKVDKLHLSLPPRTPITTHETYHSEPVFYSEAKLNCSAEEKLFFAKSGLQTKVLNQLRRGQMKIEARLDLHRLTAHEAIESTAAFLAQAQMRGFRCVLIIHGKGQYSKEGKSILKSLLNEWLPQQTAVLAFVSSQPKDGGTGALYVLLKRAV